MDTNELKSLAEAATPGLRVVNREWSDEDLEYQREIYTVSSEDETLDINVDGSFVGMDKADAEFIAAANPVAVLALIAENEALRKALREVMTQVDGNIREAVRDCVNGHNDVQDIYGYCDAIEAVVGGALLSE